MVMNDVYSQTCGCCGGRDYKNEASASILFTPELMAKLLLDIFNKEFDVETEISPELYRATVDTFRSAIDEGFIPRNEEDMEYIFYQELKHNMDVWAAFRTHRMQNDIASQLVDEDGKLKEFRRFRDDVESIIGTYNNAWLETEYNTAVLRAHQAADWKRFIRDADIFPNLRWMPTTSAEPDYAHKEYWSIGLTLPINHPFWRSHRPGDRWNCKCSLEQTDDEPTPGSSIPISKGKNKPSPGLENNPADGKIFSDTHPYVANAYPGAVQAVEKAVNDIEHYSMVETIKGRLRIHDGHGKHEREENICIGKYLAEKYGYEIDLLDNPQNKKSADSYNHTLGIMQEYKMASTPTVNAIDRLIRDGRKQADNIVLWLDTDIPLGNLRDAIISRIKRADNVQSLTIVRNGKDVTYNREDILKNNWEIKQADFK